MCKANCVACTVAVSVLTNGGVINLPDVDRLNKGTIRSVLIRRNPTGTTRKNIKGQTLAADTVTATAHLTLVTKNGMETLVIPLESVQRDFNAPDALQVCLPDIATSSSYITLDTSASGYNSAHVIELIFGIDCPPNIC